MTKKLVGKKAPNFKAECTSEKIYARDDFNGKNLVLYFYPKDSTPGCTTEGQNFRDLYEEFQANNTEIIGVSRDSIKSHENFKEKQSFPFELLSDPDEKVCKAYDVMKLKSIDDKPDYYVVMVINAEAEKVAELIIDKRTGTVRPNF